MASSFWKFRPSALVTSAASAFTFTSAFSRAELTDYYEEDNRRAMQEGVKILQRPESSKLRILQWNINSGRHNNHLHPGDTVQKGLIDAIRDADADVVVLNEYCDNRFAKLETFEKDLKALGYHVECATVDYPTAMVTRLKVKERKEVILSWDRSALLAQVETKDNELVWVIGTHLNHMCGERRQEEMQILTKELSEMELDEEHVVLVGDLNQQRSQDYASDEWGRICLGMEDRNSCQDDGVAKMLTDQGFVCAWDETPLPQTNWETPHPPATHWSSTIVDYSYGCNASPLTLSISPVGWSDHRLTVCDWAWSHARPLG